MKLINEFIIDDSDLNQRKTKRTLRITGTPGAIFNLRIKNATGRTYDFDTNTFNTTITQLSKIELSGTSYTIDIFFPAVSSDDQYDFYLYALPHFDTNLLVYLSRNPVLYTTSIAQKVDTTITFSPISVIADEFDVPANVTFENSPDRINRTSSSLDWTILSKDTIASGGLVITRQPVSTDFYTEDSFVASGSGDTIMILTTVTDLVVGATLSMINGVNKLGTGSGGADVTIIAINKDTKTVTLSETLSSGWSDTHVIKFRAYGKDLIEESKAMELDFEDLSIELVPYTVLVNQPTWDGTQSATATITLDSAWGIRDDVTTIEGIGVSNHNDITTTVDTLTYAAKTILVTTAQQLKDNTILTINNTSNKATIKGTIFISVVPQDDLVISLNIDNLLTASTT